MPCIVNGWFMHDAKNWPLHPSLNPLFIGFHLANKELLKSKFVEYYKSFAPIGCRDFETVRLFQSKGVSAYFSGCPTLCFPYQPNRRTRRKIIVVDADRISCDWHTSDTRKEFQDLAKSFPGIRFDYRTHRLPKWIGASPALKLFLSRRKIAMYANARLVITNRLHVALPCKALGTRCIFLHQDPHQSRIASYVTDLHCLKGYNHDATESFSGLPIPLGSMVENLQKEIKLSVRQHLLCNFG